MLPLPYWITVLATAAAVITCVILHYEGLRILSDRLPMPKHHHRRRIVILILCLLILHSIEIWIFGAGYFSLQALPGFGEFVGFNEIGQFVSVDHLGILDCVYYSAAVFTTLGFGDIVPTSPNARIVTSMEAVMGQLYVALFIGRLVGLSVSSQSRTPAMRGSVGCISTLPSR